MKFSNTTFFTKEYLKESILPKLLELGKINLDDIVEYNVSFSDKLLGNRQVIYPSFQIILEDGKQYIFKLYKDRIWLHNTNFFPDVDFLNFLELSLMNDTFYLQGDLQVQLLLKRNNIFSYIPKSNEYILCTLYHYSKDEELPYMFLEKTSRIEMYYGYFIMSEGVVFSIPKALYFQILNSTL